MDIARSVSSQWQATEKRQRKKAIGLTEAEIAKIFCRFMRPIRIQRPSFYKDRSPAGCRRAVGASDRCFRQQGRPDLFRVAHTPRQLAELGLADSFKDQDDRSRSKAKNRSPLKLVRHGQGAKTASRKRAQAAVRPRIMLNVAFGQSVIAVDTHTG
jgi:hypothetical protein